MMLKENNTLKELNLGECKLQPEGLEDVIKGVQVNTKLETLVLSCNTIDNKSASCLGKNDIIRCGIVCTYAYVYMKKLYIGMFRLGNMKIHMCVHVSVVFYVLLYSGF